MINYSFLYLRSYMSPTHIQEVMEKLGFVRSVEVETLHVLFIWMSSLCVFALFVFQYIYTVLNIYIYIYTFI